MFRFQFAGTGRFVKAGNFKCACVVRFLVKTPSFLNSKPWNFGEGKGSDLCPQIETHPRRSLCPHIDELCRMLRLTWLTRHAWPRYAQLRAPCPSARQRRAGRSWRPGPVPRLRVVCLDVIGVAPGPLGRLCLGWVCLGCPCRESGAERSSLRREPGINLNP